MQTSLCFGQVWQGKGQVSETTIPQHCEKFLINKEGAQICDQMCISATVGDSKNKKC